MATVANVAAYLSTQMNSLVNNTSGQVQSLVPANQAGGQRRAYTATIALASQASASLIALERLPLGAAIIGIREITDTSLSGASISFGNANNLTKYAGVHTLTSTNAPVDKGLAGTTEGCLGVPLTTGYDCITGNQVLPTQPSPSGGASFDDIVMSVTAAALPASGNLTVIIETLEV